MKKTFFALMMISGALPCEAASRQTDYYDAGYTASLRETRDTVDRLRHQVGNQETELRVCEQKLENLNVILDTLRDQSQDAAHTQKEQIKGNTQNIEMKLASLENSAKSLAADIKQLQSHANETSSTLQLFDKRIQSQNQNIEHLQAAMQTLMDAFQVKVDPHPIPGFTGKTYRVKTGDSLGEIARAHGTTIKAIKELNGMTSDRIIVGKTLKIPD